MAHRRLTSAEKGKGVELEIQSQPPRAARVRAPQPDNLELIRKHSLTLIGRVTNKSVQKVWSLIPFFTEHWKTEFKPVGSDLGNGLFQFQFELESDLTSVLEQRPYHYARWMVIIQRWEPTVSPSFPSLIPFWIKVQGLPVHLWTEPTIKCIGEDIGRYEKAEITSLTVRMRVHVDGLLPLIKILVVEFPNGDEVATTLVYERLDKHCTKCLRLDHELKECLVARAEARTIKESQGEKLEKSNNFSAQESGSVRGHPSGQNLDTQYRREREQRNQGAFQFSASNKGSEGDRREIHRARESQHYRPYKPQANTWQERSSQRHSYYARERSRGDIERSARPLRESSKNHELPDPPTRSYYREIQRSVAEAKDTGSSISKPHQDRNNRGSPLVLDAVTIPEKTLDEARNEVRDVMMQYTKCSDPTEREARKERLRQAEVRGQVEEAVVQVARASLNAMANEQMLIPFGTSPERLSATQRLGPTVQQVAPRAKDQEAETNPTSREKEHVSLRLGESQKSPISKSRTLATLRLGPVGTAEAQDSGDLVTAKRKPGRPPGRRVVHASPTLSKGNSTKRRTVQATKPPTCRRKIIPAETRGGTKPAKDKFKGETSRPAGSGGSTRSSENLPLSKMIPKTTRKKAGFQDLSTLVP